MPAKTFLCSDQKTIDISDCLKPNGCRLQHRCSSLPYLRLISFDREYKGLSPSMAGNGPMMIYLKATKDYVIDPNDRVWAAFGTSTHAKLGLEQFTSNVLSEERLSDDQMEGIADLLEKDESGDGYILYDFKNWGSYKVMKALGITVHKEDVPILDENNKPVLLKSGKNKGKPKTKQETKIIKDPNTIDLKSEIYQLNRYRIFFENHGFKISQIFIQAMVRDGNMYMAKGRGIDKNMYMIPVPFMPDQEVLDFYTFLAYEVSKCFKGKYRKCNEWESWEGRRCNGYCEVSEDCKKLLEWGE